MQRRSAREVVLFDLDGTLTDPFEGIARSYDHALARLGATRDPAFDYRTLIGPPLRSGFDALLGPDPVGKHERAVRLYREHFATTGLFENTPYDGIVAMLARVSAIVPTYICTSKPTVYAERILGRFQMKPYIEAIYGCELDGTRGDKAELLAWILAREAIRAEDAVLVGDRMHDVLAARKNGAASAGVLWGYGSAAELRDAGAAHVFARPQEITPRALLAIIRAPR